MRQDFKPTPRVVTDKGEHGGTCNRTACDNRHANEYNLVTRKYYCIACARKINEWSDKNLFTDKPLEDEQRK